MAQKSHPRLEHLERVAYWRGKVSRADLTETYAISGVQASNDLQEYHTLNPGALQYDLRKKRFFWRQGAKPVLYKPDFADAVNTLLAPHQRTQDDQRMPSADVQRKVLQAIIDGAVLDIAYAPVSDDACTLAIIPARAYRVSGLWQIRAWCVTPGDDWYVLALADIKSVRGPRPLAAGEVGGPPPPRKRNGGRPHG